VTQREGPAAEEYEQALRDAVFTALSVHPPGCATVAEDRHPRVTDIWSLTITPSKAGPASTSVTFVGGDEIVLGIGDTHVYLWDDDPEALGEVVRQVLTSVYAGRVQETGMRGDARVKVIMEGWKVWRGGSIGLPVPWPLRRVRRYAPLSTPGEPEQTDD
jgi:hypothetical protein